MQVTKVIATATDKFGRLLVKIYRYGTIDVQTPVQVNPPGLDSNPIKDMVAIYGTTDDKGTRVIVGYMNKNQITKPGETRLYSTDADGNLKTYIWCKNDGKINLGGAADNVVRFKGLDDALNKELVGLIPQLQLELTNIAAGIAAAGGTYTPGTLTCDIDESKAINITTE